MEIQFFFFVWGWIGDIGLKMFWKLKSSLLLLFLNFSWSIVDLQCCVNFYCTAKWTSHTYKYILYWASQQHSELFNLNNTFLRVYLRVLSLSSSFLFCSNRKILSHIPLRRGCKLVAEIANWGPTDCSNILFDKQKEIWINILKFERSL